MKFGNIRRIEIPEGSVHSIRAGSTLIWKKSDLPPGYTELDYIEVTGTQYVDLGFYPNQDSHVVCEFLYLGGTGIYGARTTTASENFALRVSSSRFQTCYGDTLGSTVAADNEWHVAEQKRNVFSLDGVARKTLAYKAFESPTTFVLGAINASNAMYYGKGRYRSCQCYDPEGVLVHDLRPCLTPEGEAGMYDVVQKSFRGNAGSGAFEYA